MGFLSLCADVIFLLEVSGFPSITVSLVDMVKACELTGFSFSVGGLAGALPNVRTRGLYSKTPIPILRGPVLPLENLTFFPKTTLQFCFVLKRKPCLQITPGFSSSFGGGTPCLTGECRGKS